MTHQNPEHPEVSIERLNYLAAEDDVRAEAEALCQRGSALKAFGDDIVLWQRGSDLYFRGLELLADHLVARIRFQRELNRWLGQ